MKILLINCPIRLHAPPNNIPYGLATIAAVLQNEGHEVQIYDLNALRPSPEEVERELSNRSWDVVGVSGLITTYKYQKWLTPILKRLNPTAPIVSGGGMVTSIPEIAFRNMPIDIAVIGEGEETTRELMKNLKAGVDISNTLGIWWRSSEAAHSHARSSCPTVHCADPPPDSTQTTPDRIQYQRHLPRGESGLNANPPRPNIRDLDSLPFPAWDLLPIEIYLKNPIWGRTARNSSDFPPDIPIDCSMNIISSRGCPYNCRFCYHLFGRSRYRLRSAKSVIAEIEELVRRYDINFVGFVDDNFMASKQRVLEFCELMKKNNNFGIHWGCHGRVTSADPDTLHEMKQAGCVWIGYGIESGSQTILDAMDKRVKVEVAEQAIITTRKAGIFANTTFIFGYPGETRQTIQETIEFKRRLGIECGSFFATPYPGTPLYDRIRHLIKDEETFISSLGDATEFTINLTDFSDEELFGLKKKADTNQDVI